MQDWWLRFGDGSIQDSSVLQLMSQKGVVAFYLIVYYPTLAA